MQANPDKFQVLAVPVGKKTYEKRPTINIQNFEVTCEDSVKLLGIQIDYQLNFDTYKYNLYGEKFQKDRKSARKSTLFCV
jgi:hypothetical protein